MPDQELENIARKIWAKHRLALDTLFDYYPDLQGEAMEILFEGRDELAVFLSKKTGFDIVCDSSNHKHIRFAVKNWDDLGGMLSGDDNWLDSNRLVAIELINWGPGKIRMSFVVGPGDQEVRRSIYDTVLEKIEKGKIKIGRRTPIENTSHKHLSASYLLDKTQHQEAEQDETSAEKLAKEIQDKASDFLERHLKLYDKIIRSSLRDQL